MKKRFTGKMSKDPPLVSSYKKLNCLKAIPYSLSGSKVICCIKSAEIPQRTITDTLLIDEELRNTKLNELA